VTGSTKQPLEADLSLAPKKIGRPKGTTKLQPTEDTFKQLRGLGQIQCTGKEAAAFFGITEPTFLKFLTDHPEAREAFEEGKGRGCISLRRHQWQMAESNPTMAIWLGKNHLGQTDKLDHQLAGPDGGPIQIITGVPRAGD
jgi:hypothetical protein